MNSFITVLLVGISLSMDAFSLSLIYGTYGINKKNEIILAVIVGLFHFFMPLIGYMIGNIINMLIGIDMKYVISIIFIMIGLEMIVSSIKEEEISFIDSIFSYLLFGFSVSLDSFTTGIGIKYICYNYYYVSFVFMLCSGLFTYFGLTIGNRINLKYGNVSCIFGAILLFIISVYYIVS